ncbi:MAG: twin-arginine translocation signal domain-containing protein [Campylobacter sp.]
MRNFIKFSAVACVCVGLAVADGGFIGVEGGYSFGSKLSTSGGSVKDGAPNIGIKGGYDWGDLRNYIQYNYHFKAKKQDKMMA